MLTSSAAWTRTKAIAIAIVTAAGLAAIPPGCSESAPASGCEDHRPPAGFDALAPAVSFSRDVLPVFATSCAFSTCHGSNVGPANGVYLGTDAARVHAAIVGVASGELPSMRLVTPGDPVESYLLRKMDGSQCALDARCSGGSCQGSMPKNDALLPVAERDVVRRWIAQGARSD